MSLYSSSICYQCYHVKGLEDQFGAISETRGISLVCMLRRHRLCLFVGYSLPHLGKRAGVPLCADRLAAQQVEREEIVDQPGMDTLLIQRGDDASVLPVVSPSRLSRPGFSGVLYPHRYCSSSTELFLAAPRWVIALNVQCYAYCDRQSSDRATRTARFHRCRAPRAPQYSLGLLDLASWLFRSCPPDMDRKHREQAYPDVTLPAPSIVPRKQAGLSCVHTYPAILWLKF